MINLFFKAKNSTTGKLIGILTGFFLLYFIFLFLYNRFLDFSVPDFFTLQTAKQVTFLYRMTGFPVEYRILTDSHEIGLFLNGNWLVKVMEGCNGISVIIIFISFILAFPDVWKKKWRYILGGTLAIWMVNLLRIYVLGLIYHYYPAYFDIAHRVFFPAAIYAMVIILWLLWIKDLSRFSLSEIANK
jgi:exosortase family protein XrtF